MKDSPRTWLIRASDDCVTQLSNRQRVGVLTPGSADRIDASPIKEKIVTDTIEYRFEPPPRKLRVVSTAKLFAQAINNIHRQTSVSKLFENS